MNRSTRRASERGATAIEYALIASLIAAVIIGTVTILGADVLGLWSISWP